MTCDCLIIDDEKLSADSIKAASEVGAALAEDDKNRENYRQITQNADQVNTLVIHPFRRSHGL